MPVATRSKAWVCGRSPAEIVCSNPTGVMFVCCECHVLLDRGLCYSSGGVLPTVVRRCVWSRNLVNEGGLTHWGLSRQKQTIHLKSLPLVLQLELNSSVNERIYLLTPWCRVLLVKKFPAFHETRRFITALTSVRHLSLSCANPNAVHIPTSHLLEIHPNIIHPSTPRSPQWSPSLRFPQQDPRLYTH